MSQTPKEILQKYSAKLSKAVSENVSDVAKALHTQDLIAAATRDYVTTVYGIPDAAKADRLMTNVANRLDAALNEKEYLVKVCNVLITQEGAKEIGHAMLKELGGGGTAPTAVTSGAGVANSGGGKELNMAAVTQIFRDSAHHYMLIGTGLGVNTAGLIPIPGQAQNNLILVFQSWFQTNKDVTWDALRQLCGTYSQLGRTGAELEKYLSQ